MLLTKLNSLKLVILITWVFTTSAIFVYGQNKTHHQQKSTNAKKDRVRTFSLHVGPGFVLLPLKEKVDGSGNLTNVFSGFKLGLAANAGFYYNVNEQFSIGASYSNYVTRKANYSLAFAGPSLDFKYNFSPRTKPFSPYVVLGFNYANLFLKRSSYINKFENQDTTGNSPDIIVNRVTTSFGSLSTALPSFGISPGLGLEMRFNKRWGGYFQYTYNYNFVKNDPIISENFIANEANLRASVVTAGIILHIGINKAQQKLYTAKKSSKYSHKKTAFKSSNKPQKSAKINKPDETRKGSYTNTGYSNSGKKNTSTPVEMVHGKQKLTTLESNKMLNNPVVTGKIVSANGTSPKDVDVLILDENGKVVSTSKTDKNGYFAFNKLDKKNYSVVLSNPNPSLKATVGYREQDPDMAISADQMKKFEYAKLSKLQNGTIVTGKVSINGNTEGADDVPILMLNDKGEVVASSKTKNGRFAFQKLPAGNYQAVVDSDNPNLKANLNLAEQDPGLFITAGDFKKNTLTKLDSDKNTKIVIGSISPKTGTDNVQDVDILALNDKGEVIGTTKTNKKGGFSFKNLPSSDYQIVVDSKNPNLKAKVGVAELDPELKVGAGKFNYGKLAGNNNTVVGQVNQHIKAGTVEAVDVLLLNEDGEVVNSVKPDKNGKFAFSKLDGADYQIALSGNNPNLTATVEGASDQSLLFGPNDFNKYAYQKLSNDPNNNVIIGTLSSPTATGEQLKDVEIMLVDENGKIVTTTTSDAKGRYSFKGMAKATYQVVVGDNQPDMKANAFVANADPKSSVSASDFKKYDYQKLNPNNNNNIILGKIDMSADVGNPEDIGFLILDDQGTVVEEVFASKTGSFTVKNLKQGNYQVVPNSDNPNIKTTAFVANGDPNNKIAAKDFHKHMAGLNKLDRNDASTNLVTGKLSVTDGSEKVEDVGILLLDESGKVIAETKTKANGRFNFKSLPKSNYQILVDNPSPKLSAKIMAVEDDSRMKLGAGDFKKYDYQKLDNSNNNNIVLGRIEPSAYMSNVGDVNVLLMDDDGNVKEVKTDKKGYFAFTKLESKNYQVIIDSKHPDIKPNFSVANSDPEMYITSEEMTAHNSNSILGTIESKNSESVSNYQLLLLNDNGEVKGETTSNKDGHFTFKKLSKSGYQVILNSKNPDLSASVTPIDEDPDLKLKKGNILKYNSATKQYQPLSSSDKLRVTGIVNNTDGKNSGVVFLMNDKGEIIRKTTTNENGVFSFNKVQGDANLQVVFQNSEQKVNAKFQLFEDRGSFDATNDKPSKIYNSLYFDQNQTEITDNDKLDLDKFVEYLKAHPKAKINLNGYGDNTGTDEANMSVTKKRAEAVMKYIESRGISKDRLKANPMGKSLQFKNKYNQPDPKLNRKVDLEIIEE